MFTCWASWLQGGDEVGRRTSVSCDVNPESCDETLDSRTPETPPPPTPTPPPPTLPPPTPPTPQAAACATFSQQPQYKIHPNVKGFIIDDEGSMRIKVTCDKDRCRMCWMGWPWLIPWLGECIWFYFINPNKKDPVSKWMPQHAPSGSVMTGYFNRSCWNSDESRLKVDK